LKFRVRIEALAGLESFLQELEARFVVLPISARACARAMGFPAIYPKDPVDRIIRATALVEGLSLITADREIRRSKLVRTIW
jgi:PIN domain nuclease of toxin-antitoxin system